MSTEAVPKVNAKERRGQTALMWAAAEGHADVVAALIAAGAVASILGPAGATPARPHIAPPRGIAEVTPRPVAGNATFGISAAMYLWRIPTSSAFRTLSSHQAGTERRIGPRSIHRGGYRGAAA